jgi:ribosomal protein L11 methyltransferase
MRAYRLPGAAREPERLEGAEGAALWEAGAASIALDGDDVVAYFEAPATAHLPAGGAWEDVDEADHVAAYHAGLEAVRIGPLVVAPTHRDVALHPGETVVWLDPGMAFGTGHHETTRLALAALGRLDLVGRRVLDVGAGSGLLAIAADRLGAAEAIGLDIDPDTVAVARANAATNRSRARFVAGGFGEVPIAAPVDVLVANLYAELHVAFLPGYVAATAPGATLLLTGILEPRDALVRAAIARHAGAFDAVTWARDDVWWLVDLRRRA